MQVEHNIFIKTLDMLFVEIQLFQSNNLCLDFVLYSPT